MSELAALASAVLAAHHRIAPFVVATPTVAMPWLAAAVGSEVRGKLENVQDTGSFKLRGATNALLCLPEAVRRRGVVAASSGNHGLAVATAAARLGVPVTVFVPTTTPPAKREAVRQRGAEVVVFGDDCVQTEGRARERAASRGWHYLSPYNDADVVAGQGTVALELLAQWPAVETIYVALGGGGLVSGIGAYAKAQRPDIEIVACSPAASPAMAECVRRGAVVDVECGATLSDSTAGGVEPGAITLPWCAALVDRFVDVDEPAIARAMLDTLTQQHLLIEGAAGVAVAGCLADARGRGRVAAVIVCGGNLPVATLRALLATAP